MDERPRFSARFTGPEISSRGVSLDELLGVLDHLQNALIRQVEVDSGRAPTVGRRPESVRSAGALRLLGTHVGSFVAELALDEPSSGTMPDLGASALRTLLSGMSDPRSLDYRVAEEVIQIRDSLRAGVDAVTFETSDRLVSAEIRRDARMALPAPPAVSADDTIESVSGRLLEVDWKDKTAEIHGPEGIVQISFESLDGEVLRNLALTQVVAAGVAERRPDGRIRRLEITSIQPALDDSAYWSPPSLGELASQQGVSLFEFPAEPLTGDGTADELLAAIFD